MLETQHYNGVLKCNHGKLKERKVETKGKKNYGRHYYDWD